MNNTVDAHSGDKKSQQTTIMVRLYVKVVVNKWEGAAPIGTTLYMMYTTRCIFYEYVCVLMCVQCTMNYPMLLTKVTYQ